MSNNPIASKLLASGKNLLNGLCLTPASRFDLTTRRQGNRLTVAVLMLAAFLVSTVAIAFDSHDYAYPKPKCSICEVKKVYKATSKTAPQDPVFISAVLWRDGERFHPGFLPQSTDCGRPLNLRLPGESDRAPPPLS